MTAYPHSTLLYACDIAGCQVLLLTPRFVEWNDLTTGESSRACTRVDWIEVYGKAVQPRTVSWQNARE